jgi:hypothetical protein
MPKPHSLPTLFNEVLQINISKLKEWGYLEPNQIKNGSLHWSRNGNPTGSISIKVDSNEMILELDYKFKDEPRNYNVDIVSIPSNLGKGEIFYFVCPHTKKKCRILYCINGYFLHREAFNNCMYESQTFSQSNRALIKEYEIHFKADDLYSAMNKKNFKKFYAGKPTKRYLKILNNSYGFSYFL